MPDLVIACGGIGWRVFQSVERTLASERRGSGIILLEPAQQRTEHGVMAQVFVVDQILVTKRHAEDALAHKAPHPMGDEAWMTPIAKARGEPIHEPDGPIRRAEKKSAGVRGHEPTVELRNEFAPARPFKHHPSRATLRGHCRPISVQ